MEGMITICTLPTVLTNFIHSIFKPGPNVIIKNKVKIIITHNCQTYTWLHHYDEKKRHSIYKELEKMKCELT